MSRSMVNFYIVSTYTIKIDQELNSQYVWIGKKQVGIRKKVHGFQIQLSEKTLSRSNLCLIKKTFSNIEHHIVITLTTKLFGYFLHTLREYMLFCQYRYVVRGRIRSESYRIRKEKNHQIPPDTDPHHLIELYRIIWVPIKGH